MRIVCTIPLRLCSLANQREHWTVRMRRARAQRAAAYHATALTLPHEPTRGLKPPLTIAITRVGKRELDSDNLAISAKHVRDGIADALGIDDGSELLAWCYAQEIGRDYAVRIEIEEKP